MEQTPFRDADSNSAGQEFLYLFMEREGSIF